jgi:hypothetical protein
MQTEAIFRESQSDVLICSIRIFTKRGKIHQILLNTKEEQLSSNYHGSRAQTKGPILKTIDP